MRHVAEVFDKEKNILVRTLKNRILRLWKLLQKLLTKASIFAA